MSENLSYYQEDAVSLTDVLQSTSNTLNKMRAEYLSLPRKKKKKRRNSGMTGFMKDFVKNMK